MKVPSLWPCYKLKVKSLLYTGSFLMNKCFLHHGCHPVGIMILQCLPSFSVQISYTHVVTCVTHIVWASCLLHTPFNVKNDFSLPTEKSPYSTVFKNIQPFNQSFLFAMFCWYRPLEKSLLGVRVGFRLIINTLHVTCKSVTFPWGRAKFR